MIGKPHQALALQRGQAAHGVAIGYGGRVQSGQCLADVRGGRRLRGTHARGKRDVPDGKQVVVFIPGRPGCAFGPLAAHSLANDFRDQVSGLSLVVVCATCSNAVCSKGGNTRPRFSARRRMPAQAIALK